jgi:predicted metal-dependent phosphoesterase TrpH
MKIDFHTHTINSTKKFCSIFTDGMHSEDEMIKQAKKMNLDGIAITEHNKLLSKNKAKQLSKKHNILVIPGIELSFKRRHYLIYNIDYIPKEETEEKLIENVKNQGGIIILAHPSAYKYLSKKRNKELMNLCDGVEVLNGAGFKTKITKYMKATLCGSDSHNKKQLGTCWSEIKATNLEEIIQAIKQNKVKPKGKPWIYNPILSIPYYPNKYFMWSKQATKRSILFSQNIFYGAFKELKTEIHNLYSNKSI